MPARALKFENKLNTSLELHFLARQSQELMVLYKKLIEEGNRLSTKNPIRYLDNEDQLKEVLRLFGPQVVQATIPLKALYVAAIHQPTGALIISSQPSILPAKTSLYSKNYTIQFRTMAIYMPGIGVELAHVGSIGEIHHKPFVLRSESACTPAFLFGGQSCNCALQWNCTQELAAYFNSDEEEQSIGFLMVYLESQNGMGMGFTPNLFSMDLSTKAQLRYAASLYAGQKFNLSMQESFQALGIPSDPRQAANQAGYKITPIILDFLSAHQELILLSNNPQKIHCFQEAGYTLTRLKALGEINITGFKEAQQRANDFHHLDIGLQLSSFDVEFQRLKIQIQNNFNPRSTHVN